MMLRIVGVTDLQRRFRAVFDDIAEGRAAYVLTRGSQPEVAMIPYQDFLRFQELQEHHVLDEFDRLIARMRLRNASFTENEVRIDVEGERQPGA